MLFASIVLILIADDALLFLLAWEAMSITSYLLVNFENERDESSRAGFLMLAMGEAGFFAVVVALLFLAANAGSLEFSALKAAGANLGPAARWLVFLLTFFGFGVKAGLAPVNSWLPRAHPAAPANVSAILSGVILNLGLYGIVRVNLDLVPVNAVGAGVVVLVVGTISALVSFSRPMAGQSRRASPSSRPFITWSTTRRTRRCCFSAREPWTTVPELES